MLKVYLDLDGVCANFMQVALSRFNTTIDEVYLPPHAKGQWNVEQLLGITTEEFWATVGEDIFYDLPVLLDGMSVYSVLKARNLDVSILTSPSSSPICYYHKALWVKHYFPELFPNKLCIYPRKFELAKSKLDVLIDDSDVNCEKFIVAGGSAILFPRLWNSKHEYSSVPVAYVTNELNKILLREYNNV